MTNEEMNERDYYAKRERVEPPVDKACQLTNEL